MIDRCGGTEEARRVLLKRLFDVGIASALLVLFSPLMLLIGLLVWRDLGRPVFYAQLRPGRNEVPFRLIKFRTMLADENRPDGDRLTRLGAFLRSTSLDELPELWNVIRGDMSLVGPRPLLMEYLPLYSPAQARRHEVRPGVTGWAQIHGRNALAWPERFALDVWYVDNRTFWLDLKILFSTLVTVVRREGISEDGEATMSKFRGEQS